MGRGRGRTVFNMQRLREWYQNRPYRPGSWPGSPAPSLSSSLLPSWAVEEASLLFGCTYLMHNLSLPPSIPQREPPLFPPFLCGSLPLFLPPSIPRIPERLFSQGGIAPPMSAPKKPRITLDPGAYHALCIQAAIEQTSPGSLASKVILSYSQEAKQALQATGRKAPSVTESQAPREGESQAPQEGGSPKPRAIVREVGRSPEKEAPRQGGKKVRLSQNPQALAKIKELWEGGQQNQAKIAKVIDYPKATTNENIKRMLKAGTLSPLDQ